MLNEIERLTKKYGRQHESLIKEAIIWLDKIEKELKIKLPQNRDTYIKDLLSYIAKEK